MPKGTLPSALSLLTAALLLAAALGAVVSAGPAIEVNATHAIAFDRRISATETGYYGSRSLLLRGSVVLFSADTPNKAVAYRHVNVFVPCREHLTKAFLSDLSLAPVNGLLVALCEHDTKNEELLSLFLASSTAPYPVYFIEEEEEETEEEKGAGNGAKAVEALLREHGGGTSRERVVVSAGKSLRVAQLFANATVPTYQIHSTLVVKTKDSTAKSTPRVLVTANFDTFGVAPSAHTTGGASGSVAAMELYRRYSTLAAASTPSSRPFGFSMLLGSSARFNYAVTATWLQGRKDAEMDGYKLIVCLDDLLHSASSAGEESSALSKTSNATLYMHVQDTFMRRGDGKALAELAQRVAEAHGVDLKVQPARTNYQHYDLRFEHEVFANRQLPAVSFSAHRTPLTDQIFRGSVRTAVDEKSVALLATRVAFLQDYIAALLERGDGADPTNASKWIGAESYLAGLLKGAARAIRCPVSLNGKPLSAYAESLDQHLRQMDSATRMATSGTGASVLVSTTLQPMAVKPAAILVHGPYEEPLKLFVAKTVAAEALTSLCVVAALALFGLSEFGPAGLKRVVLGA